jgi:hypothetical protein
MILSTPRRVFSSSCGAISSGVPRFRKPPAPKDDEIYVFNFAILERRQARVEKFHRTQIDVEVEPAPHPQQNILGVLIRRHARVAERARQNRVELAREHVERAVRQAHALA